MVAGIGFLSSGWSQVKTAARERTHRRGNPFSDRDSRRVSAWIEVDSWHAWDGGGAWPPG